MAWDREAFKEQNKRSALPVSAFCMIDSVQAIQKCIDELGRLTQYGLPDMRGSAYFDEITGIHRDPLRFRRRERDAEPALTRDVTRG